MIQLFNHNTETIHGSVLLNDVLSNEIKELCVKYSDQLAVSVILENVQKSYGFRGVVVASFFLGQICAAQSAQNTIYNSIQLWQREN